MSLTLHLTQTVIFIFKNKWSLYLKSQNCSLIFVLLIVVVLIHLVKAKVPKVQEKKMLSVIGIGLEEQNFIGIGIGGKKLISNIPSFYCHSKLITHTLEGVAGRQRLFIAVAF